MGAAEPHCRNLEINMGPYTTISGVLGFLLSFRTSQAVSRFEDGAHAVYDITGGLVMAASSLAAFAHHGSHRREEVESFKQRMTRLMSLLSAMMLTELEGVDSLTQTNFEILDLRSLSVRQLRHLARETNKTEVVVQWLKTLVIDSLSKGILSVPAPILARVFHELDVSVGRYFIADKLSQVPFPFPYVATMDLIMVFHSAITPIVMVSVLSSHPLLPITTVFLIVFFLWSIHLVAGELENPFDGEMNDLDLFGSQCELNEKLKAICSVQPQDVPRLVVSPEQASHAMSNTSSGRTRHRRRTAVQKLLRGGSKISEGGRSTKRPPTEHLPRTTERPPTENSLPEALEDDTSNCSAIGSRSRVFSAVVESEEVAECSHDISTVRQEGEHQDGKFGDAQDFEDGGMFSEVFSLGGDPPPFVSRDVMEFSTSVSKGVVRFSTELRS